MMDAVARPDVMTIHQSLRKASLTLQENGIENARFEARELLAHVWGCRTADLVFKLQQPMEETHQARLDDLVHWRCHRLPLAQVLGEWDFRDMRLKITKDVLIPRPETEELFETVVRRLAVRGVHSSLADKRSMNMADVGTGSGCLAIALAKYLREAVVWAIDMSAKALSVARDNIRSHGLLNRIHLMEGDLLQPILGSNTVLLDAVVANLPYIKEYEIKNLSLEVQHEPFMALNGGIDGLCHIRRLIPQAYQGLRPSGFIFLEVGYDQAETVAKEMCENGFYGVKIEKDFSGIQRFVIGTKK